MAHTHRQDVIWWFDEAIAPPPCLTALPGRDLGGRLKEAAQVGWVGPVR
eukprot:CAMPEP_0119467822 /NCGR_PEP_ID=MMETSP1344-20130328/1837_1 /TAXON_ID=236787 /ORGANISM="Florenciella parvula, Strain CCMP2471" /LENGTH=48 /DNA_ID= /DNA_START= /DNA_END= /DNA_ORIENTATION=